MSVSVLYWFKKTVLFNFIVTRIIEIIQLDHPLHCEKKTRSYRNVLTKHHEKTTRPQCTSKTLYPISSQLPETETHKKQTNRHKFLKVESLVVEKTNSSEH